MILFCKYIYYLIKPILSFVKKALLCISVVYAVIFLFIHFSQRDKEVTQNQIPQQLSVAQRTEIIAQSIESRDTELAKYDGLFFRGLHCVFLGLSCSLNNISEAPGGLIGRGSQLLTFAFANPIASGVEYISSSLASSGMIAQARAAEGIGFSSLSGYQEIWKAFRDLSFLIITLIIIAIGFMIMFRTSTGQAEVNIENSLPRIVFALILITFSFAFAGFFIDLMYAIIAISIGVFNASGLKNLTGGFMTEQDFLHFAESGFLDIIPLGGRLIGSSFIVGNDIWNLLPGVITSIVSPVITLIGIYWVSGALTPATGMIDGFKNLIIFAAGIGNLPSLISGGIFIALLVLFINYLPGLILGLIIGLTLLIFMIKMLFIFLSSYIKILLFTLFSPFILLFSAIPGNSSASWWVKNMLAELSVFPTFVVITMTSATILQANLGATLGYVDEWIWHAQGTKGAFNLPFIAAGFRPESFNNIVSLGLLLMAPEFIKIVKGLFGAEDKGINFSPGLFFGSLGVMGGMMGAANSIGTSIMGQGGFEKFREKTFKSGKDLISATGSVAKDRFTKRVDYLKKGEGEKPPLFSGFRKAVNENLQAIRQPQPSTVEQALSSAATAPTTASPTTAQDATSSQPATQPTSTIVTAPGLRASRRQEPTGGNL